MPKVESIQSNHPLIGTWITENDDSAVEFTIYPEGSTLQVKGRDRMDGESFVITEIEFSNAQLSFRSTMPSTGHTVVNRMKSVSKGLVDFEYTIKETWVKVD
ncbi:hypothetical protein KCM76_24420 [Zooshikella marina]|uniref:hypothetical protein n=1 Tax=Zooshikella ganghwensis TaxID=202772 RepID=UPI001BB0D096|nr:hypothetical protein [Zooshikella ganghwensis]MBU2709163.1 hypothetical protein [Zooshikella ganghwensis]